MVFTKDTISACRNNIMILYHTCQFIRFTAFTYQMYSTALEMNVLMPGKELVRHMSRMNQDESARVEAHNRVESQLYGLFKGILQLIFSCKHIWSSVSVRDVF